MSWTSSLSLKRRWKILRSRLSAQHTRSEMHPSVKGELQMRFPGLHIMQGLFDGLDLWAGTLLCHIVKDRHSRTESW